MGKRGRSGRRRKLSPAMTAAMLHDYELYVSNMPKVICARYGVSLNLLDRYVREYRR